MPTGRSVPPPPPSPQPRRRGLGLDFPPDRHSLNYAMALFEDDSEFAVTLAITPFIVGKYDWVAIYATQSDLESDLLRLSEGKDADEYEEYEWVSNFDDTANQAPIWVSSVDVQEGAVAAYFSYDYRSLIRRYIYMFSTAPYVSSSPRAVSPRKSTAS